MKMTANRLAVLAVLIKHQGHDVEYWDLVDWAQLPRAGDTWQTVGVLVEMGLVAHSSRSMATFDGHKLEQYTEHTFTLMDTDTPAAQLRQHYGIEPEPQDKPDYLGVDVTPQSWGVFKTMDCRATDGCRRKAQRQANKTAREKRKAAEERRAFVMKALTSLGY